MGKDLYSLMLIDAQERTNDLLRKQNYLVERQMLVRLYGEYSSQVRELDETYNPKRTAGMSKRTEVILWVIATILAITWIIKG